jgi:predicted N-acetyltransferase YhbS
MLRLGRYTFQQATTDHEFEQIHRLNYRTFVEEVPQHHAAEPDRLVDKFHDKNTYFVAVADRTVVGMISVHDQPPFSIAARLPDPAILSLPGRRSLEVRLLAVEPAHRGGPVMIGLLWTALVHARENYDDVYISGVEVRVPLYERLGFRALGPAVPDGTAAFVPMRASFPLPAHVERLVARWTNHLARPQMG